MKIQIRQLKRLIREAINKIQSDYQIPFTCNLSIGPREFVVHYDYDEDASFDYEYAGSKGTHQLPGGLSDNPTIEDVKTGKEFELQELLKMFVESDGRDESGQTNDYAIFKRAYKSATTDADESFKKS